VSYSKQSTNISPNEYNETKLPAIDAFNNTMCDKPLDGKDYD